ncbi:MAG: NYN domain-containing protein [Solirubrobacteraceae bacterium]
MDSQTVHIFWDHSNLFCRAQDTCDGKKGGLEPGHRLDARLSFQKVYDFAAAGRTVEKAVAVGSVPPGLASLWQRLGEAGVIIDLQERGAESGKEQGVDQALKLEMMNSIVDREQAAVMVLLSGDGGFLDTVERALNKGWGSKCSRSPRASLQSSSAYGTGAAVGEGTSNLTPGTSSLCICRVLMRMH